MMLGLNLSLMTQMHSGVSAFALYAVDGIEPDLVADFVGEKYKAVGVPNGSFDDVFTYTGASLKTMVDSDGVLKWAPHNLVLHSEDFSNAAWSKTSATVTANAIAAPDGTLTADKVVENVANTTHGIQVDGPSYIYTRTNAIFAKAGERDKINIWVQSTTGAVAEALFDLTSGTVTTAGMLLSAGWGREASITAVGNGWYFCKVTATIPAADSANHKRLVVRINNGTGSNPLYTGDGTSGIYIWGAHLYRSDLGGMVDNPDRGDSYVPTTTAAVYLPRRGHHTYSGSAWVNKGILIESEARTNLLTQSEDFTDASWAKTNITVTANNAAAPSNATTADLLAATAANATALAAVTTTAIDFTFSVYLKRKTGTGNIDITMDGTTWATQTINDTTWTRVYVTQTGVAGTSNPGIRIATSGDEVWAWGAQAE